ncbi:MAG: TonB C-terminal domain-containing protein [Deltaproteobacteria bacterium]|nr:TonB C-terminal domain-containing protein [Deltaproteobacteria bacterium]
MRSSSRRVQLAVLASVLLHGALAVFVLTRKPTPPPKWENAPLVIEIREKRAEKKPPPPAPLKPTEPPKKLSKSNKSPLPKAGSHTPQPPQLAEKPSAPPSAASPGAPEVPSAAPAVKAPNLADAATRSADRVAQNSLALEPPKLPPPPEDRSVQAPFVIDNPNERVASMLREPLGRDRVERGMYDPYFHQMGEAMSKQWQAEKKVDEKGLKGFLDEAARGLAVGAQQWMLAWQAAAEQYGKTGNPGDIDGPYDIDGRLKEHIPPGVTQTMPNQLSSSRIALVRITQGLNGKLLHVELVQPSIDPAMDAEVMRELKLGEMVLPVPPTKGMGIHDPIRSIWAFQLTVSIAPPAPMISGSFDIEALFDKKTREEMGGSLVDVRLPLSRRISKRVDLVSVE